MTLFNLTMKIRNQFILMTFTFFFLFLGWVEGKIGEQGTLVFNLLEPEETGWYTRPMAQ